MERAEAAVSMAGPGQQPRGHGKGIGSSREFGQGEVTGFLLRGLLGPSMDVPPSVTQTRTCVSLVCSRVTSKPTPCVSCVHTGHCAHRAHVPSPGCALSHSSHSPAVTDARAAHQPLLTQQMRSELCEELSSALSMNMLHKSPASDKSTDVGGALQALQAVGGQEEICEGRAQQGLCGARQGGRWASAYWKSPLDDGDLAAASLPGGYILLAEAVGHWGPDTEAVPSCACAGRKNTQWGRSSVHT